MKTAIVFYSMNGNVRMVAEKVAGGTSADLIELIPKKAYPDKGMKKFMWGGAAVTFKAKPDLEPYAFNKDEYDMVILGSPVWAGTFAPPLFPGQQRSVRQEDRHYRDELRRQCR